MNETLKEAEDPSFDQLPRAIVAPHIDYFRGWPNYAHVYGRMRVVDRPDRVIILGTNHFGRSTGVAGCDKGFETPLGLSPLDQEFVDLLTRRLGEGDTARLFEHRYDHEREHSIEAQMPWLQHVFGDEGEGGFPKVFGALVHDPTQTGGESYDGSGLALGPFVEALRAAVEEAPGRTLVVCSADLSHVGAQFGDGVQMTADTDDAKQMRERVVTHDREMLALFEQGKPVASICHGPWLLVEADVVRQSVVRPSTGAAQERLVVRTRLRIGPLETEADVSLVCRRGMRCRMLVGRTAIAGLAVVDPGRIHVLAPTAAVPTRGTAVSLRARRRRGRDPSTPSHEGKA